MAKDTLISYYKVTSIHSLMGLHYATLTNHLAGKAELNSWEQLCPQSTSLKHHTLSFHLLNTSQQEIKLCEIQRGQVVFQLHTAEMRWGPAIEGLYSLIHSFFIHSFIQQILTELLQCGRQCVRDSGCWSEQDQLVWFSINLHSFGKGQRFLFNRISTESWRSILSNEVTQPYLYFYVIQSLQVDRNVTLTF